MTAVSLADRWGRLFAGSALAAAFRASLLYRLTAERLELLALCLIVLLMPFIPVAVSAALILAAGLLSLVRAPLPGTQEGGWRGIWSSIRRTPLLGPALVFWAVLLLLSFFSVTPRDSLQVTILFGIFIAFYLVFLKEIGDERRLYIMAAVFLVSAALEACLGLYQNFISRPLVDPSWVDTEAFSYIQVRVFGTLDNPNILAQYLIPGIVLGLGLALRPGAQASSPGARGRSGGRLSTRLLFLGLAGVAGLSLILTWSRMGWLSLALAIAVFLLFYDRRLLLAAAALVVLAFILRPELLSSRLTSILNPSQDSSIYYRLQIWQVAGQMIGDFWFSGVGPGTAAFQAAYNKFYAVYGMRAYHTHNLYLEMLVEYGVFGTSIFLWLLLSYFGYGLKRVAALLAAGRGAASRALLSAARVPGSGGGAAGFARIIAMAGMAAMASYLSMGLMEDCWYNFKLVFLFWFLVSLTISAARLLGEGAGRLPDEPGGTAVPGQPAAGSAGDR